MEGHRVRTVPRKLRVLHVISSLEEGGAAKGTVELVSALNESGRVDARLCVLGTNHRAISTDRISDKVMFLDCPVGRRSLTPRRWRKLRGQASEFRPDIIHSHLWPTVTDVSWALLGKSIPHVIHVRDSPPAFAEQRWQSRVKTMLMEATIRLRHPHLVAVSRGAASYAARHLGFSSDRVQVLLNAVDLSEFAAVHVTRPGRNDGQIVVGSAGRLIETKGYCYLVEAIARLRREGLPVVLKIAGSGGQRAALDCQIRELGIADAVTILDYRPDVHRFYEQLDIYALPSFSEGLSRSLIEAMACGRAVVAADCEGTREVVRHQEDGIIVPVRDSAAMADALGHLARDVSARDRFGQSGRQRAVETFSIDRLVREVIAMYEAIGARG